MRIYLYSGYILKTEPNTYADRLNVRKGEESRRVKHNPKLSWPENLEG